MKYVCPNCGQACEQEGLCPICSTVLKTKKTSTSSVNARSNHNSVNKSNNILSKSSTDISNQDKINTNDSELFDIIKSESNHDKPMRNESYENHESHTSGFFDFCWFIFVGSWMTILNLSIGIVLCLTIIGIPFGLNYFKFIPMIICPSGREVVLDFSSHQFLNAIQLIFGGFRDYLFYIAIGVIFMITIIGIPIGIKLCKIAKYYLAPFGAEIE